MKTLLLTTLLCVTACLASLGQSPVLPANLPKSLTAISVADFLKFANAADNLKVQAEARIAALQAELAAVNNIVAQGDTLTRYDEAKRQELMRELSLATADLNEAQRVFNLIRNALPRRYRKQLEKTPTFMVLYDCLGQYEADLKRRGKRLFVTGAVLGFAAKLFIFR